MAPQIDTSSKISLRDAIWIGSVVLAALWGAFQLTSAVRANTAAIKTMTQVIDQGFVETRSQLGSHETRITVLERQSERDHGRPGG